MKNLKRLALLLTTVMMFFTLTACSSQPTTPTVPNPDTNGTTTSNSSTSQNEVELVNRDGVRIVLVGGLDTTGSMFGSQLKVRIENNTGHDITVQRRNTSVNGYTMDAIMSTDVNSGEKAYGTITFYSSKLQDAGITTIKTIKTSFLVFDQHTWQDYFLTDPIIINF